MKEQRVAIVYPDASLDTVPSLHAAALLLSEHGYLVDVFTFESAHYATPVFDNGRVNLRLPRSDAFLNDLVRHYRSARALLPKLDVVSTWANKSWGITRRWVPILPHLIRAWRLHRQNPYRCVIGVDPVGLLQGNYLARLIRAPLVYYSLELLLSHERRKPADQRLKKREIS